MQTTSKSNGSRTIATTQKSVTAEDIENAHKRVMKQDSFSAYWKITNPKSGTLRLSKAHTYVTGTKPKGQSGVTYNTAQGNDRLVYWMDYRVAGRISDIERVFREAGIVVVNTGALQNLMATGIPSSTTTGPLNIQTIINNSIDPLQPEHARFITMVTLRFKPSKSEKKQYKYELTDYIDLANALPQITAGTAGSSGITKKSSKAASKGVEHSLESRVEDWKTYMSGKGDPKKMIDVTRYNPVTHAGANKTSGLDQKPNMITLTSANNRRVPITAQNTPEGIALLRAYIQNIGSAAGAANDWVPQLLLQIDQHVASSTKTVPVMATAAPYTTWATSPQSQVPAGAMSPSMQFTAMAPAYMPPTQSYLSTSQSAPMSLLGSLSNARLGMN